MLVSATYCCIHTNNRNDLFCPGFGRCCIWPCITIVSAAAGRPTRCDDFESKIVDALRQPVSRK